MKMKRTIAALLALILTVAALPLTVSAEPAVWDGSVATSYAGGSGTQDDPYLIASGAELAYLAQEVNAGVTYEGIYFKLVSDIALNDTSDLENWGTTAPTNVWPVIGVDEQYNGYWPDFRGYFDGNGHTVSGVYINGGPSGCYVGLFGYVTGGWIRDLGVVDSYVSGYNCVGSLVGYFEGEELSGCYSTATVVGSSESENVSYVGGLAGECDGPISGCYYAGQVTVTAPSGYSVYNIGGVVGYVYDTTATDCYNAGSVTAYSDYYIYALGGVVGAVSYGTLTNCYNVGSITADSPDVSDFGGVVGCVEDTALEGLYYLEGSIDADSQYDTALTPEQAVIADSYTGFAFGDVWAMGTGDYPYPVFNRHTWVDGYCAHCDTTCAHESWAAGSCATCGTACDHTMEGGICTNCGAPCDHSYTDGVCDLCGAPCGHAWNNGVCADCGAACDHTMEGGICTNCGAPCDHSYTDGVCDLCGTPCGHDWNDGQCTVCGVACPGHSWNGRGRCEVCGIRCVHTPGGDGICAICGFDTLAIPVWDGTVADGFDGGSGTKEDPYLIANGDQLAYLAQRVNGGGNYFYTASYEPVYVVLVCDIDLNDIPFTPIGDHTIDGSGHFMGCFDGQGHTIYGLNTTYGLFGKTGSLDSDMSSDSGRICNVNVQGQLINTEAYYDVGGIVGRAQGGVIENCSFTGTVTVTSMGYYFYGGIVGEMENGFIFSCVSNADTVVTGEMPRGVGGIAGGAEYYSPRIDGCTNTGDVASVPTGQGLDGIVGRNNNEVTNCVSTGTVWTLESTAENYMNVKHYRSGDAFTAPTAEGKLFAGWFTDEALTQPLDASVTTGWAYAKFVDAQLLSLKYQISNGTTAESTSTDIRFLTAIDGPDYQSLSFRITFGGRTLEFATSSAFRAIIAANTAIRDPQAHFGPDANYFVTMILGGVPQAAFDQELTVVACWTTLDGTEVTGTPRTFTVSDFFT